MRNFNDVYLTYGKCKCMPREWRFISFRTQDKLMSLLIRTRISKREFQISLNFFLHFFYKFNFFTSLNSFSNFDFQYVYREFVFL